LRNDSHSWQHTLEGYVTFTAPPPVLSYSLMFRNGAVEGVAGIQFAGGPDRTFLLQAVEKLVLGGWKTFRRFAVAFGIEPPMYVFPTLIEIKGLAPPVEPFSAETPTAARKDALILPEVTIGVDQLASAPEYLFKRLFDTAANAFGLSRSPSYIPDGKFIGTYAF